MKDAVFDWPPKFTIRPRRRWRLLDARELWQYRELMLRFSRRDITLRYRQTALGITWVVLQPLLAAGILSFVFGSVARLKAPAGIPYFVFSLVGLVAWNTFSQTVTRAGGSLMSNAVLLSKVYFPRMLLPFSTVGSTLLDAVVSLVLVIVLLVAYAIRPGWAILLLPVWLAILLVFALGLGLASGATMVRYRDVQYILPVAVQFFLFASPIAYSLAAVPSRARWLYELNPLTGALEGFRWSLLGSTTPPLNIVIYSIVSSVIVFALGLGVFNRAERRFADVI